MSVDIKLMTELSSGRTEPSRPPGRIQPTLQNCNGVAMAPVGSRAFTDRTKLRVAMSSQTVVGETSELGSVGRILLIDDERRILNFVSRGLRSEGFEVDVAETGLEGLEKAASERYDLIVLDLLMPEVDGKTVLRGILRRRPDQTVIVLSALDDSESKVLCLELGADDYLAKPFFFEELLARVRARLRGAARSTSTRLSVGGLTLDVIRRQADSGAGPIALAEREFLLLQELMRNAGRTVSKERLLSSVWGYHFDPETNVVDVYVRRLRAKLGAETIHTLRGEGYRIDAG
jgi:two-component system copper resistance phosphate regulon response regulator CusR